MWLAAISLGFFSSLHCIGMCGPLALLASGQERRGLLASRLFYNAGRIVTYSLLGLVVGVVGEGIYVTGVQSWLSIGLGLAIIVYGTSFFRSSGQPLWTRGWLRLKQALRVNLLKKGFGRSFFTGVLNGFLPCGIVYLALSFALLQPHLVERITFMTWFGVGTLPAMLAVVYAGETMFRRWALPWGRIRIALVIAVGVFMIVRGVVHTDHHDQDHAITECW